MSVSRTKRSHASLESYTAAMRNPPSVGPAAWKDSGSVPPAASVAAATVARYSASVPPGQKCVSR